MANDKQRLELLLARYIENKSSPAEEAELFELLSDAEGSQNKIGELVEELMAAEPVMSSYKANEWQAIVDRIRQDAGRRTTGIARMPVNIRWMAAASIVLLLGLGSVLLFHQKKPKDNIASTRILPDIKPPSRSTPVLTLSNGQQIILDSPGNQGFNVEHGIRLTRSSTGEIAYNVSGLSTKDAALVYNTISNPRGSNVVSVVLSDGTKVWLNAESSVRYPVIFTGSERNVELMGEAYFEVRHDASKPFYVTSNGTQVRVLGTHFNINSYNDEKVQRISLLEGSVQLQKGNKTVVLRPGQQGQIDHDLNNIAVLNDVDLEQVIAWKNGLFDFDNEHITQIMRQLARWYDIDVAYTGKTPERHYTGAIKRSVNISEVIKMIEYAGGAQITIGDKKIIVKEK